MQAGHPISLLLFGTFAIAAIILAFLLIRFLRKSENRHPMDGDRERNIDEIREEGPGQH